MKRKHIIFTVFFILLSYNIFSQVTSVTNITYSSAVVNFNTTTSSTNLHVFTKSFDDTIIFKENFAKFPKLYSSISMCQSGVALNIPYTYTLYAGCQARNLYSPNGDTCYFNANGEFVTPQLDLSKANGNYRIKFFAKNTSTTKIKKIYIAKINNSGDTSNITTISLSKNTSQYYDTVFYGGENNTRIRFSSVSEVAIDSIIISYPQENVVKTPISSSPFNLTANTTSYNLSSLTPNTKYYCYIEGTTDIIAFTTDKKIVLDSVFDISPNTAKISYTTLDNTSSRHIIVKKKSNYQTVLADDLFISEITTLTGSDYNCAIEIYNGIGKDVCLKDYSVNISYYSNTGIYYNLQDSTYKFSEKDTIKNNSCIVLSNGLNNLTVSNDGIFYRKDLTAAFNGNDPFALIHNQDTIDVFGSFQTTTPTITSGGWKDDITNIQTAKTILRRKANIHSGITTNPSSGFPTLSTEWTQIGNVNEVTAENLSDFGKHTMNGAIENFDSVALYTTLSNDSNSFNLTNLDTNTVYEVSVVVGSGEDSVVSNVIRFRTGNIKTRTANGTWNDKNWDKGLPNETDIAQVLNTQTLEIPQNYTAKCYNLVLKDEASGDKPNLINNGTLDVRNKIYVENYIKGYTSNTNGWNLIGLPIKTTSTNQDDIKNVLHISTNDDLYYWQEDYSENNSYGRWVNYKVTNSWSGDFFNNQRGYLVAYQNDTKLTFNGELNNENSYTLLNNASLSSPTDKRGWHLVCNPYPFSVSTSQLTTTNFSNPQTLNSSTGNYETVTTLLPYSAFMVQTNNSTNSLIINKNSAKSQINNNVKYLTLSVVSSDGYDKTKIAFDSNATNGYEIETDNHKLHGLSNSPEIYSVFNGESFLVNVVPTIKDSAKIDINFISKTNNDYTIKYNYDNSLTHFQRIILWDKQTNTMVADFLNDSIYTFHSDTNINIDKFQLRIYKNVSSIENPVIKQDNIIISQKGDMISVDSKDRIKSLTLINVKGQTINRNENKNTIHINQKGLFVLKVRTDNSEKSYKITFIN
ncbi:MAG: hypothetical protein LKE30_03105 [Bacteroidales bacterium]|jgi:hypothetical protein|nr:hypothetical protein [Bacteroidales bacterium]